MGRIKEKLFGRAPRLAAGDFPAGAMAPLSDLAQVPLRPTLLGVVPRGELGGLLAATQVDGERETFFRTGCAIDVKVTAFLQEDDVRKALIRGGDNQGVDVATIAVSSLAMSASLLREAAPRVFMLLGRSRGQDVVVTRTASGIGGLKHARIAAEPRSASWYLLLWTLSRGSFSLADVTLVPLASAFQAADAMGDGTAAAAAGYAGDLAAHGTPLLSTADAPNLIALVLIARGDFAARYPDALRRIVRCTLLANQMASKDASDAARALATLAPRLGDPKDALRTSSLSTLADNLAFFGMASEPPVGFREMFQSAANLNSKLFDAPPAPAPEDLLDLTALNFVATVK